MTAPMAYAFAAHLTPLGGSLRVAQAAHANVRSFVLIDSAQVLNMKKPLQRIVADAPSASVFEESFARSAMELSPVIFELSSDTDKLGEQILALDAACRHLPVMSLIHSPHSLQDLAAHLRSLLLIEADGDAYLLRFADTQMLAAANAVFTPTQRACFFAGLLAWFTVDYQGQLCNAADSSLFEQAHPAVKLPLALDAQQTQALLSAAAIPMLASQLRHLDSEFAQKLSHAEQITFVSDCAAEAQEDGIDEDSEIVTWALQRWQGSPKGLAC